MIEPEMHASVQDVQESREGDWRYGFCCWKPRSELERAASEARSRDLENRFEALIDEATYRILERAERAEEAAVGALRSSLCGLEAQAASADVAAATTAQTYLALLEREGLTAALPEEP